jgi:uncharacterized protein (TIGR02594 family)
MIEKSYTNFLLSTRPKFRIHRSPIPPWVNVALGELGQAEIVGDKDNPNIVEYLKAVNLKLPDKRVDEIAWCSAFVNWVMKKCGYAPTERALAKSWLNWGEGLGEPRFGCITILDRGSQSWMGHVGFLMDITPRYVYLLGGNQSNRVSIRPYASKKLRGWRWPKE